MANNSVQDAFVIGWLASMLAGNNKDEKGTQEYWEREARKAWTSFRRSQVRDVIDCGYAPGGYLVQCGDCKGSFGGDKRAWRCKECATKELERIKGEA